MKHIIIILAYLLLPLSLLACECSKPEQVEDFDSPIAYMEDESIDVELVMDDYVESLRDGMDQITKKYHKQLKKFLTNSNDINIQLSTIDNIFSPFALDESKRILKKAINKNSDKYTMFLAASLCNSNKKLTDWCHKRNIHKIHQQIDPENVFSYLFALHDNVDMENNEQLLLAVDNSQHANSFFFEDTLKTTSLIDEFNQLNPILYQEYSTPANDDIDEINKIIQDLQLVEKGLINKDIYINSENFNSIILAWGMSMAKDMTIRPIHNICKQIENANSCIQIGKLLSNSDTIMINRIGIGLIKQSYELLDYNISDINQISDNSKKEMEKIVCFNNSSDIMYTQILNEDFMIQFINDAKQFGESKAHEKIAFRVYEIIKKHGFNPDFNPHDC